MAQSLPPQPNLEQLRHQAKDLLKAHKRGDNAVCGQLRSLKRFAGASDRTILDADLSLNEAQFALALDYGFTSWSALVQHVKEVRGESTVSRVKRSEGKVWIEGLPKLQWARSGECTYAGALSVALSATEHPFSYSDLMGFTGLAFRFRWYRRTDTPDWCPSSPTGEFPDEIAATRRVTGWQLSAVDLGYGPKPSIPDLTRSIIESVEQGRPVIGHQDEMDMAVLYGFEKNGGDPVFLWDDYNWREPRWLPLSNAPRMIIIPGEHRPAQDTKEAFAHALAAENWRQRSKPPDGYPPQMSHAYLFGDVAFKTWADDLRTVADFTPEQRDKLFYVGWWCFRSLQDARQTASVFLNEHAELLGDECAGPLQKAATFYGESAAIMAEALKTGEAFLGPWTGRKIDHWTPEVRDREIDILGEVRRRDADALREIDRALKILEESGRR